VITIVCVCVYVGTCPDTPPVAALSCVLCSVTSGIPADAVSQAPADVDASQMSLPGLARNSTAASTSGAKALTSQHSLLAATVRYGCGCGC